MRLPRLTVPRLRVSRLPISRLPVSRFRTSALWGLMILAALAALPSLVPGKGMELFAAGGNGFGPQDEAQARYQAWLRGREAAKDMAAQQAAAQQAAAGPGASLPVAQVPRPTEADAVIPALALRAYRVAEGWAAGFDPTCKLPWSVLAGIGRIESDHGRHFGALARFSPAGDVTPTILGPVLDGTGGTVAIRDTDGGRWDGDSVWDRAVGPMQFIPSTWQALGRDGNGDGLANPNNLFDAAVSAAGYLCLNSNGPMTDDTNLRNAIYAYNHSWEYVSAVITWANFYQQRAGLGSLATVPVAVGPSSSGAAAGTTAAGGAGTAVPPVAAGVPGSPTSPTASRSSGAATTQPGSSQTTGPGTATTGTPSTTSPPATQPPPTSTSPPGTSPPPTSPPTTQCSTTTSSSTTSTTTTTTTTTSSTTTTTLPPCAAAQTQDQPPTSTQPPP